MLRPVGSYVRRNHLGLLALFIALGGTSYAAAQLPRDSVGTEQLRKGAVRTADIRNQAVTLAKIRRSTRQALRGKAGPQGATGARGARGQRGQRGLRGVAGPRGTFDSVVVRYHEFDVPAPPGPQSSGSVNCQAGERAVGGGVGFPGETDPGDGVVLSGPTVAGGAPGQGATPTGWTGAIHNGAAESKQARVWVVCAR